jgi:TPR repeat protein
VPNEAADKTEFKPVKIGRLVFSVDLVVVLCFVATALAAFGAWQARSIPKVDKFFQQYFNSVAGEDAGPMAVELAAAAKGKGDAELWAIAGEAASKGSPWETAALAAELLKDKKNVEAGRLAAFLYERGALITSEPDLYLWAGWVYLRGISIDRDYVKAMSYLGQPSLVHSAQANFLLGQALMAEDNPARDPKRGYDLIHAAAEKGLAAAKEALKTQKK